MNYEKMMSLVIVKGKSNKIDIKNDVMLAESEKAWITGPSFKIKLI